MFNRISIFFVLVITACNNQDNTSQENQQSEEEIKAQKEQQMITDSRVIISESFATLSAHLKSAMEEGGVQNAVEYCNLAAYPLTDSIAKVYGVTLKRTSLQLRNPSNQPIEIEREWLEYFADRQSNNLPLTDTLVFHDGRHHFFKPILLMDNCRKCHGQPGIHISEEDFAFILEKYPDDNAINFQTDDLRGMWVVQWNP